MLHITIPSKKQKHGSREGGPLVPLPGFPGRRRRQDPPPPPPPTPYPGEGEKGEGGGEGQEVNYLTKAIKAAKGRTVDSQAKS